MIQNAHIVCLSGGESSAITAVEVFRKFGSANLILLNHDICSASEAADIKRFKNDIAGFCGVSITYANMKDWFKKDQFDVVVEAGAFKVRTGTALCTNRMKTEPFYAWLKLNGVDQTSTLYYGFDATETARIQRRSSILAAMGYRSCFPQAQWPRTLSCIADVGIMPPTAYQTFKHANCTGCLKAGMQHWYIIYCTYPDIWNRARWAEDEIGYTIIKGHSLEDLEEKFEIMRRAGVQATERLKSATFWKAAKELVALYETEHALPCECTD